MSEQERYKELITAFGFEPSDGVGKENENEEITPDDIEDLIDRATEMTENFYILIGVLAGLLPDSLIREIYVRVKQSLHNRYGTTDDTTDIVESAMYSLVERVRDEENEDGSDLFALI
jgi:hypothetical protein